MSRQSGRSSDPRKVSQELFTLTYGSLVSQLVKDYESDEEVNKQLDKIIPPLGFFMKLANFAEKDIIVNLAGFKSYLGYNIGIRLVEDFLARSGERRCNDFRETADIIAKSGFKMFLGITPLVSNWSAAGDEFSLILDNNPLTDFVELPEERSQLNYSNILCGVIRGALETVQMDVNVRFVQDILKGDNQTEIKVKFIKRLEDAVPAGEE